jgi:hypothetical protein
VTSLRLRMLEDMQIRILAVNTQEAYVQQVSLFARHFNQFTGAVGGRSRFVTYTCTRRCASFSESDSRPNAFAL